MERMWRIMSVCVLLRSETDEDSWDTEARSWLRYVDVVWCFSDRVMMLRCMELRRALRLLSLRSVEMITSSTFSVRALIDAWMESMRGLFASVDVGNGRKNDGADGLVRWVKWRPRPASVFGVGSKWNLSLVLEDSKE